MNRTALTVAVIRGDSVATATIGDTACFVATGRRAKRVGRPTDYLDPDTDPAAISIEKVRLPSECAIVVASGGLLEAAFSGGAGDNIAVAVTRRS